MPSTFLAVHRGQCVLQVLRPTEGTVPVARWLFNGHRFGLIDQGQVAVFQFEVPAYQAYNGLVLGLHGIGNCVRGSIGKLRAIRARHVQVAEA